MRVGRVVLRLALAIFIACATAGCLYLHGDIAYNRHPDSLRNVHLATGLKRKQPPSGLGLVIVRQASFGSCDALVTDALRDLLNQARVLGGSRVMEVRFRGRWAWRAYPVCRITPFSLWLRKSVAVKGIAVR